MKMLITGDLHLSDNPRDEYRFRFIEHTLPRIIKEEKIESLQVLGDITEQKDNHSSPLVNRIADRFWMLSRMIPIRIIAGNHDYVGSAPPFFRFLGGIESVKFYSNQPFREGSILYLPHTRTPQQDWRDLHLREAKMIFAHATFTGAVGANGMMLPGSIARPSDSIRIVSGDVHIPQTYVNVTYVGAPYRIDFGDEYEPRVLLLFSNNGKLKSIPVPGPQKRLIYIDLDGQPKGNAYPGDIVKVRVELKQNDYASWPETCDRLRTWGTQQGFTVHTIEPIVMSEGQSPQQRAQRKQRTDEQLIRDYCASRNIDERTCNQGLKLINET